MENKDLLYLLKRTPRNTPGSEKHIGAQFTGKDLLAQTVCGFGYFPVDNEKGEHAARFNLQSGKVFVLWEEGFDDSAITHAYLVDTDKKVHYSSELISPSNRNRRNLTLFDRVNTNHSG